MRGKSSGFGKRVNPQNKNKVCYGKGMIRAFEDCKYTEI